MTDAYRDNGTGAELRIDQLSSDQVDDAARTLAGAFLDERMFIHALCEDRDRRERATIPFFRAGIKAHLPYGGVHSAMLGDKLVGVAVRLPPEHDPLRGRENVRFFLRLAPGALGLLVRCPGARHILSGPSTNSRSSSPATSPTGT